MTTRMQYLLAGIMALSVFTCLVLFYDAAYAVDSRLALLMNTDRGAILTTVMIAASKYGREYFWTSIVVAMLIFGKRETKIVALELAILFVFGIFAGETLKHLIYKARPFETMTDIVARVPKDYDSSFPSGHALIVTIGATYALVKFKKKSLAIMLTLEAAIVACSRVYVGMHYPRDVVAAICLGSAIVFLWMSIFDRHVAVFAGKTIQFMNTHLRPRFVMR